MKAYKGCVNRECKSFKGKRHYKDKYDYCPFCGGKLEYVCADCWKVLEHNTEKYCVSCEAKREQKRAQQIQGIKEGGKAVAGAVGVFGGLAMKHKSKIIDAFNATVKVIKK